jgi:hypothetical protein
MGLSMAHPFTISPFNLSRLSPADVESHCLTDSPKPSEQNNPIRRNSSLWCEICASPERTTDLAGKSLSAKGFFLVSKDAKKRAGTCTLLIFRGFAFISTSMLRRCFFPLDGKMHPALAAGEFQKVGRFILIPNFFIFE